MSDQLEGLSLTERLARLGESAEKGWKEYSLKPIERKFFAWEGEVAEVSQQRLCGACLLTAAYVGLCGVETEPTRRDTNNAGRVWRRVQQEYKLTESQVADIQYGFDGMVDLKMNVECYQFGLAMRKKVLGKE